MDKCHVQQHYEQEVYFLSNYWLARHLRMQYNVQDSILTKVICMCRTEKEATKKSNSSGHSNFPETSWGLRGSLNDTDHGKKFLNSFIQQHWSTQTKKNRGSIITRLWVWPGHTKFLWEGRGKAKKQGGIQRPAVALHRQRQGSKG